MKKKILLLMGLILIIKTASPFVHTGSTQHALCEADYIKFKFKNVEYWVGLVYSTVYKTDDFVLNDLSIINKETNDTVVLYQTKNNKPISFYVTRGKVVVEERVGDDGVKRKYSRWGDGDVFDYYQFSTFSSDHGFPHIEPKVDEDTNLVTVYYVTHRPKIKEKFKEFHNRGIGFHYDWILALEYVVIDMENLTVVKQGMIGEPTLYITHNL